MAYGDFKDLPRRTASDKISSDKAFNFARNPNYDGYQRGFAVFNKITSGGAVKSEIMSNQELAKELHKSFHENEKYTHLLKIIFGVLILWICNWWVNLIKDFDFYYALLIFTVIMHEPVLWKIKKGITVTNAFQNILDESNCKSNKIWVHKASEFYYRSMKSWLQDNDIEMHSRHNEGKSVVTEKFIRTLKNKFFMNVVNKKKDTLVLG